MAEPKGIAVPFRFDTTGYPASDSGIDVLNDSIFTILSTYVGERVHRPTFGSFLKRLIFEPLNRATAFRVQSEIRRAISQWEKRVTVQTILFAIDNNTNTIKVHVTWVANGSVQGTTVIPVTINSIGG